MLRSELLMIVLTCVSVSVSTTDTCKDEPYGLTIAESSYSCSLLTNEDHPTNKIVAAYQDRHELCKEKIQQCCQSCKEITGEHVVDEAPSATIQDSSITETRAPDTITSTTMPCEDKVNGLHMADGAYDCHMLKKPNTNLGAYEHRRDICDKWLHQCCKTCQELRQQKDYGSTSPSGGEVDVHINVHYGTGDDASATKVVVVLKPDADGSASLLSDKLEVGVKTNAAETGGPTHIVLAACILANIVYVCITY